ncbi:hypothetical protein [Paraherbaspirillum soli]|uniref:Uncharacterized protein n=1 Tax=Paraherbaspirillum soli TaxID=631222 RepID=A0ABW0MH98_9BURK
MNSPKASHHPFSWLVEELRLDQAAQFLAYTLDMTHGIYTCLALIHASNLAREHEDNVCPPRLSVYETELMTRFAMAATGTLSEQIAERIDALNKPYLDARLNSSQSNAAAKQAE